MNCLINMQELAPSLGRYLVVDLRERQEYEKGHVAGAVPVPVDPLLNDENNTLLPAWKFAAIMSSIGATVDTEIVLYDDNLGRASCRFWFVAKHYGHKNIFVLDGGVKSIIKLPLEQGPRPQSFAYYYPGYEPGYFCFLGELLRDYGKVKLLDVRSLEEYNGSMPMNNPRGGHLHGAAHISLDQFIEIEKPHTFQPQERIEEMLAAAGLKKDDTIVTYCQSGVRAAVAALAMRNAGFENTIVYEGSMFEWSRCLGLKLDNEVFQKH